ncbi:MAG: hypothetical protein GXX78_06035 [Bacteroidales bacterium]|jgi:hypothetical protein|nr:hypothetical protein [Bacteroidales bacterium]
MKAIYTIILVCFLATIASNAKADNATRDIRKYKTELKLTSQQMQQLDAIYSNAERARAKLSASPANGQAKMEQRRALMKKQRQDVRKVLTPQQRLAYAKMNGVKPKKGKKKE